MKIKRIMPFLCLITGVIMAIITAVAESDGKVYLTTLKRPAVGENEKDYRLSVSYDGIEGTVDVSIGERRIGFKEAQEIFKRGQEEIIGIFDEKNGSTDEVTDDLYLPESVLDEGLEVTWTSGNRNYIFDDGTLDRESCGSIGASGQIVVMTAKMSIQDYEAELEIPVCITENVLSEEEKKLYLIRGELARAVEGSAQLDNVDLPVQIKGENAEFYVFKETNSWKCLLFGVMAAVTYILVERQKQTKEKEVREKELKLAFAPIIIKFTLLTGAGISIKGAWEKLVGDYKKEPKKNAAYEEMLRISNEMQNGLSEGQAYVTFGKRCKLSEYVKFGNLLEQNLRKGTKGLVERLEHEVWEAFEERKALAYRLGEEASTKLLLPMLLSLGIVIAFCVVPAFLNM